MQIYIAILIFRVSPLFKDIVFLFNFFFFFFSFGQAISQGRNRSFNASLGKWILNYFGATSFMQKKNHDIKSGSGGSWGVWLVKCDLSMCFIDWFIEENVTNNQYFLTEIIKNFRNYNYKTPKDLICPGEKFNIFFAKPQIKKKIKAQKSFRLERSWNKNISADRRASTMIMIN